MANQSNWIRLVEENQPQATEFAQSYWDSIEKLPEQLSFLKDHSIESLSSNKSYLLFLFRDKLNTNPIVGKVDINAFPNSDESFSLLKKESEVLKAIEDLEIAPKLIAFCPREEETMIPDALFTSLEGLNNNLNGNHEQEWWENHKDHLIQALAKLHSVSINSNDLEISQWFDGFVFSDESLYEVIIDPDSEEETLGFFEKLKETCNAIIKDLDKNEFVLCHNNLCKSSVLYNPLTESKFKFINFHKSIIGPRELDLHSIYHRLGLEDYNNRSGGIKDVMGDIKTLYKKYTGHTPSFSEDFKFLNTVQRIMLLLFENNLPPTVLYQSDLLFKYSKRVRELSFLKRRLFSILNSNDFSHKQEYSAYKKESDIPISDIKMYG